jgi:hypothetical protein
MRSAPPPRRQEIVRIFIMVALLVGVIVMQSRCGRGVDNVFKALEGPHVARPPDGGRTDGAR